MALDLHVSVTSAGFPDADLPDFYFQSALPDDATITCPQSTNCSRSRSPEYSLNSAVLPVYKPHTPFNLREVLANVALAKGLVDTTQVCKEKKKLLYQPCFTFGIWY